jgi:hypothetical protein
VAKKSITGEVIKLKGVRLSFPTLDIARAPKGVAGAKESFGATFLLDPATDMEQIKLINNEINRLRKEAWGGPHPKEKLLPGAKTPECFGKGDLKTNNDGEIYAGYEGMYFVSGKNDNRPLALIGKREMNDPKAIAQQFYGGCYVNANINFWVQDNDFGKAIRCGLRGVQFLRDGEAFGGGRASADEFDNVDEGEGMEGLDGFDDLGLED